MARKQSVDAIAAEVLKEIWAEEKAWWKNPPIRPGDTIKYVGYTKKWLYGTSYLFKGRLYRVVIVDIKRRNIEIESEYPRNTAYVSYTEIQWLDAHGNRYRPVNKIRPVDEYHQMYNKMHTTGRKITDGLEGELVWPFKGPYTTSAGVFTSDGLAHALQASKKKLESMGWLWVGDIVVERDVIAFSVGDRDTHYHYECTLIPALDGFLLALNYPHGHPIKRRSPKEWALLERIQNEPIIRPTR